MLIHFHFNVLSQSSRLKACLINVLVTQIYAFEKRYVYFSSKDAYSRYATFIGARPEITNMVPAKYIAQYLKVRPETLCRIRAKYLRNNGGDIE